jgi:hypothetical protein
MSLARILDSYDPDVGRRRIARVRRVMDVAIAVAIVAFTMMYFAREYEKRIVGMVGLAIGVLAVCAAAFSCSLMFWLQSIHTTIQTRTHRVRRNIGSWLITLTFTTLAIYAACSLFSYVFIGK